MVGITAGGLRRGRMSQDEAERGGASTGTGRMLDVGSCLADESLHERMRRDRIHVSKSAKRGAPGFAQVGKEFKTESNWLVGVGSLAS